MLSAVFFGVFLSLLAAGAAYAWFFGDPNTYTGKIQRAEHLLKVSPRGRPVPHHIWQTSKDNVEAHRETLALHPGWDYEVLNDIMDLVRDLCPQLMPKWDTWHEHHRVQASRYLWMLQHGGVHLGPNQRTCQSLDRYLPDGYAVLGYRRHNVLKFNAVGDTFMAAPADHPFFHHCVSRLLTHTRAGGEDVAGVEFLTRCVQTYTGDDLLVLPMPLLYQQGDTEVPADALVTHHPMSRKG